MNLRNSRGNIKRMCVSILIMERKARGKQLALPDVQRHFKGASPKAIFNVLRAYTRLANDVRRVWD